MSLRPGNVIHIKVQHLRVEQVYQLNTPLDQLDQIVLEQMKVA